MNAARAQGLLALLALSSLGACHRADDDVLRVEAQQLTLSQGEAAMASAERLARHGRKALPSIEAALHTADEPGRKNLILALRKIGEPDSIPLLFHLAAWDPASDVRREASWTLRKWAAESDERAARAKEAVRKLDELKQREEAG